MAIHSWADTCSLCDGTRFWTSKIGYKPRHNFVYLCGEFSRPYRIGVTLQI
jgi:hypothetical protein